jgi:hypothetical protein
MIQYGSEERTARWIQDQLGPGAVNMEETAIYVDYLYEYIVKRLRRLIKNQELSPDVARY